MCHHYHRWDKSSWFLCWGTLNRALPFANNKANISLKPWTLGKATNINKQLCPALLSLWIAKHEDLRYGLQGIFFVGELNSLGRITPLPQDNPDSWAHLVFLLSEWFMCRLLAQMTPQALGERIIFIVYTATPRCTHVAWALHNRACRGEWGLVLIVKLTGSRIT